MEKITIESTTTTWYKAYLEVTSDGDISVAVWVRSGDGAHRSTWKPYHRDTIPGVPMHIARDQVLAMLNSLPNVNRAPQHLKVKMERGQ